MVSAKELGFWLVVVAVIFADTEGKSRLERLKYCSVVKAGYRFSYSLYNDFVSKGAGNLIFSPYSISSITAMVMLGAAGDTERELRAFLQYGVCNPDMTKLHESHRRIRQFVEMQSPDVTLTIADRIFPSSTYRLRSNYTQKAEYYYGSTVQTLDFTRQSEASRFVINNWIEQKTNGILKDMMPPGSINSLTQVVLANAIYFKGTWQTKFNPRNNIVADFYTQDGKTVSTTYMTSKGFYKYASNDVFSIVELPYNGDVASMFIVLPKRRNGLGHIERSFSGGLLHALNQYGSKQRVFVRIPKFKLEFEKELADSYKDLGAQRIFFPGADFSAMSENRGMFISSIRHKAFIEVNEEGTEAAAATVVAGTRSLSFGEIFDCSHPFMFFIVHKRTKSILFLGRYVRPT